MKHLALLIVLLALSISTIANAVPNSVVTGPYKVSFDLGVNESDYNITIAPPQKSEALAGYKTVGYGITITNLTNPGYISVITVTSDDSNMKSVEGDQAVQVLRDSFIGQGFTGVQSAARSIDGDSTSGAIVSGYVSGLLVYQAKYVPLFDPTGLSVSIVSTYPWEPNTLSLLKTIHVEKAN